MKTNNEAQQLFFASVAIGDHSKLVQVKLDTYIIPPTHIYKPQHIAPELAHVYNDYSSYCYYILLLHIVITYCYYILLLYNIILLYNHIFIYMLQFDCKLNQKSKHSMQKICHDIISLKQVLASPSGFDDGSICIFNLQIINIYTNTLFQTIH